MLKKNLPLDKNIHISHNWKYPTLPTSVFILKTLYSFNFHFVFLISQYTYCLYVKKISKRDIISCVAS